jgi:translation initiation factor 1
MSSRIVYRSDLGRMCPECGRAVAACTCVAAAEAPLPARVVARLRLERRGRGGKEVTVLDGLPAQAAFLSELAGALKRACGVGGTVRPGTVELAGDVRERVRPLLAARGIEVRG